MRSQFETRETSRQSAAAYSRSIGSFALLLYFVGIDENLRSSVPPPIVRSELGGSWRRLSEKQNISWKLTPVARLIFETKNRGIFLERFFWRDFSGEKLLPVQLCSH